MIPYLLLLVAVVTTAYFGRRSGHSILRKVSLLVVGLILTLFAGLRDFRVGTDTGNYVRQFMRSESFSAAMERRTEFGFNLLTWVARSISDSYNVMLLMIAAIVVICYVSTIIKLTRRYETAIFLFIAIGIYTFFFNGARQGIAAAICFMAIPFLLERRAAAYFTLVALGATFHQTALIAAPLYYLASDRAGWKRVLALALATVIVVLFLQVFVGFAASVLDDKYAAYAEQGEGGGQIWVIFLVCQGVMLYMFKTAVRDPNYVRLLNIYLIGLVLALASTISSVNPSGLLRLHLYFSSTAIVMWPMVFGQFRNTPLRGVMALGFLAVTISFYVLTTSAFSNLVPYRASAGMFNDH
ncbi:EpsG family protein [Lysobacter sp. A03]|uniref:EpsG family protein n=1 Tax=Lysobacter sp. A03 TaxID=1199154 RepID=UPI000A07B896|nr:EpsG family protein [Lysobacter sp. A03]